MHRRQFILGLFAVAGAATTAGLLADAAEAAPLPGPLDAAGALPLGKDAPAETLDTEADAAGEAPDGTLADKAYYYYRRRYYYRPRYYYVRRRRYYWRGGRRYWYYY
jgi:hypothetical protein